MLFGSITKRVTERSIRRADEAAEAARVLRIERNWSLYWGKILPPKEDGEPADNYRRRVKMVVNLLKRTIAVKRAFLYGTGVAGKTEDEKTQSLLEEIWDLNRIHAFRLANATTAMVSGTGIVQPTWMPTGEAPGVGWIKYRMVPPQNVTAWMDPQNPEEMAEVHVQSMWFDPGREKLHDKLEIITPTFWRVIVDDAPRPDLEIDGGRNPYGVIPLVFFRNSEECEPPWGGDEVSDMDSLQGEFNCRVSDLNQVIKYHRGPILKTKGITGGDVVLAPNRTLNLTGAESDAEYLEWDQNVSGATALIDRMVEYFATTSSVPAPELMNLEGLGNLTSGVALKILYAGLIRSTQEKQLVYGAAEERLANMTLTVLGVHTNNDYPEIKLEMEWPADLLPVDELRELEIMQMEQALGVSTRADQIQRKHPDWDEERVQEYMAEIDAEQTAKTRSVAGTLTTEEEREIEARVAQVAAGA